MDYSFIKDFIFPGIIAVIASVSSYFATYKLHKNVSEDDKKLKTIDLIDYLVIDLNKLIQLLDKLKEDAEKYNFFLLTNIEIAKTITSKLKSQTEKVILFSDDNFRRQIIENIDTASSIVEEMDIMEKNPVNEANRLQYTRSETLKELRKIRLKLLEMGFYIDVDDNSLPKRLDGKEKAITKKKGKDIELETVNKILLDLVSNLKDSEDNLQRITNENEKKRSFLVIRILDIQTKLREISSQLTIKRSQLVS